MEWIIVGIAAFGLLGLIIYIVRSESAKNRAASDHQPHKPGTGNDPNAIARSVSHGHGIHGGGGDGGG